MSEVKISVIVPIYNVETYLPRCIDSVLAQSFRNFELLLIDDGATDSSGKICDEYVKKDERIHVFHKKNGGPSDARNYGIEKAEGEYLTFIDPDDYIAANYLEVLYQMLTSQDADISIVCSQLVTDMNADTGIMEMMPVYTVDSQEAIRRMLTRDPYGVAVWGKLYVRSLFDDIRFPVGRLYEDMLTSPYVFANCHRVAYTKMPMYFYYQRTESTMNRPIREQDFQAFDGLREIIKFVDKRYPEIHDAAICRYIDDSLIVFFHRAVWKEDYAQFVKQIKAKDKGIWKEGMHNQYLKKTRKMQILMLLINIRLFQFVYRIKAKQEK
ncbi:MAG: glycosyltransferase [Oscillospiraceae bacterium]|nr:glycosyltransferase [Oscillospiraceae bacterium]